MPVDVAVRIIHGTVVEFASFWAWRFSASVTVIAIVFFAHKCECSQLTMVILYSTVKPAKLLCYFVIGVCAFIS